MGFLLKLKKSSLWVPGNSVNYDILIFVFETWLTQNDNFSFPGFIEFIERAELIQKVVEF